MEWTEFFIILDYLLPFYPPNNPNNQNFEKLKNKSGDIIIFHMCTMNDNYMLYGSKDYEGRRAEFFVILDLFFAILSPPLPHLTTQKIKILKN